jgi:SAM-dependent methyltransferase
LPAHTPNSDRFLGLAGCYDGATPAAPQAFVRLVRAWADLPVLGLVVDLGCGTGLSSRIWGACARRVVGVEPNPDMRALAAARGGQGLEYREGFGHATGLGDACADAVVCSQALHWMEPQATLREAARILRPGGVFAAVDCDWPPSVNWRVEQAYITMKERADALEAADPEIRVRRWPKQGHLSNLRGCGHFVFAREVLLHGVERGGPQRLVDMALSQGGVAALLRRGVSEADLGLEELRRVVLRELGAGEAEYVFSYRVRLAVKPD